ncbi:hypothetical protein FPQ18DRAFT_323961 [Pyronema domesticum]|uniref:Uncharacterized protein n=1 Tax=Pyronema omphalodes (strain CBS 100304) TaxID=1076935 RepID=U4KUK2_PYROM|nr:hypothetical protein FPQ18DRAFT_323961 [Pyronema domesticum]CCX04747.1 Protein of unknown function [Pyronema omphalodes CBS 100304]
MVSSTTALPEPKRSVISRFTAVQPYVSLFRTLSALATSTESLDSDDEDSSTTFSMEEIERSNFSSSELTTTIMRSTSSAPPGYPPNYGSQSGEFPLAQQSNSLNQVVSTTAGCNQCSLLQLQLHLLSLQNEAYLAQRDYLMQHQPPPSSTTPSSKGVLAYVISTVIRAVFLMAYLIWPWVKMMLGRVAEWEKEWKLGGMVRDFGWKIVGMTWGIVIGARKEKNLMGFGGGATLEGAAKRGLEELVKGVGEGVREGLGLWGVKMEA